MTGILKFRAINGWFKQAEVGVFEVHDNEYQKSGIYYQLHSDKLSIMTGYYPLPIDLVDDGRYFSSEEKAHKAYVKMKENCPLQASFVKEAEEVNIDR